MQSFMMNNQYYELQATNQIAVLLAQFDSDYLIDVMDDTLNQMFTRFDLIPRPNIVQSFESVFKELYEIYPTDRVNIDLTRAETYRTIIEHICAKYAIRFIQTESVDLFTLSSIMYDFFISNYNSYMINFYVNLIMSEKHNLANALNVEDMKKSKDHNLIYNKMAFNNDQILTAIAIHIPEVLKMLSGLDISDDRVYRLIYGPNEEVIELLETNISPTVPLFQRFNSILFNESLYGSIVTHIRMVYQQVASN